MTSGQETTGKPITMLVALIVVATLTAGLLAAAPNLLSQPPKRPAPKPQAQVAKSQQVNRPLYWQPLGEPGSGGWITSFAISPFDSNRRLMGGDMLGIGLSVDGGKSWQATFGLKSYEIADFTWHPTDSKTVWVGTMSGPYLSKDGGKTWQEKRQGLPEYGGYFYAAPIEKVLYDPTDANHLLAFGGSSRRWESPGQPDWGAVWESRDGGERWVKIADIEKNIVSAAWVTGSANQIFVALSGGGIWKSGDAGKTWQKSSNGLPHDSVERIFTHPKNPQIAWTGLENARPQTGDCLPGGIFKTSDGGASWQAISSGLSQKTSADPNMTARYKAFVVSPSNPDVMYAADGAWNTGVIYGTKDGGKSWQAQATKGNIGNDDNDPVRNQLHSVKTAYFAGIGGTVMAVDPNNADAAYCLGSEHLIGTSNGGAKWTDEGNDPVPNGAWKGRGFSGLCATHFAFNPKRPGDALAVGMDAGKLWRSVDGLKSWTYHGNDPWPWGGGVDACYAGSHIYATAGQFGQFLGIIRTTDDGKTWNVLGGQEHGLPALQSGNAQPGAIYARPDAPKMVSAIIAGKLYTSSDAGEKWSMVQEGLELNWLVGDPTNSKRLYLSSKNGVFVTADGGKTVGSIGGPKPATRLSIDARGRLYATSWREQGGVWRYTAGKWTRLMEEKFAYQIAADPTDPTRLAVATHDHPYHDVSSASGVWISADDGKTWRQANEGLAILRGESITFDPHVPGRMVFGTHGRGFFITTWPKGYLPKTEGKSYTHTAADTEAAKPGAVVTAKAPEPPAATGAITLRNGDMEQGTDIPASWDSKWVGKGNLQVARDTTTFKGGKASLRVASEGGEVQGQAAQIVDAAAGVKFTLTGFVKSQGTVRVNVAIQPFNASWTPITFMQAHYVQNDTDWTAFKKEITLPQETARFGIVLLLEGTGTAWLDEVKVSTP